MKRYLLLLGLLLLVVGCQLSNPQAAPQPTPAQDIPQEIPSTEDTETNQAAVASNEIKIMGKYGFDPQETRITAAQVVVWRNDNPQKKIESLVFQKMDAPRTMFSSDAIRYGETYTQEFEPGTYDYWSVGFGVKGRLIVE